MLVVLRFILFARETYGNCELDALVLEPLFDQAAVRIDPKWSVAR